MTLSETNLTKKTTLENGLTVTTETLKHVNIVAVGIWVKTGSRHESEQQAGITHFLEHMLFKGTERRSAYDIALSMESIGGQLNATTTSEHTCYYARCLNSQLSRALEVLSDMILHPTFPKDEIEKEKRVIMEEMKSYRDSPGSYLLQHFNKLVFDGHPLGRPVIGFEEAIANFKRQDLFDYMEDHYQPDNLLVAAAGNIEHSDITQLVHEYFPVHNPQGSANHHPSLPPYQTQKKKLKKQSEQTHLILGRRSLGFDHDDKYKLLIANAILGGGMSSRLHQHIRERHGYVYSIKSFNESYKDTGVFNIYTSTYDKNADRVEELIWGELQNFAEGKITNKEFNRAKAQLKGKISISLENTSARMQRLAKNESYFGRFISLEELLSNIDAVKIEEIRGFMSDFFDISLFSKAVLIPTDN